MADDNTQQSTGTNGDQDNTGTSQVQAPETFSREYVEELRRENASHRTGKKEAVDAAKAELTAAFEARLAEKDTAYTELQNELGKAWVELEKVHTAIAAKVPSDKVLAFASILQGEDPETIKGSAASAKKLFGDFDSHDSPTDPTQGSGGQPLPLNGDKLMQALNAKLGIS